MITDHSLKIKYFKSYSLLGEELLKLLETKLVVFLKEDLGFDVVFETYDSEGMSLRTYNSSLKVLTAAFCGEIVIIDASIEEFKDRKFGVNYDCITPAVSSLDNVILVSRTQLPLNFIACRSNVAPLGEPDGLCKDNYKGGYSKSYSNSQILSWLKDELKAMHDNKRLIRSDDSIIDMRLSPAEMMEREMQVMKENTAALALEKSKKDKNGSPKKKSFISYRTKYCPRDNHDGKYRGKYSVVDVASKIKEYHRNNGNLDEWDEPFYYPHGVLSNEFMPEIRRWGFVSLPDRKIRECKEFWIFNTNYSPADENGNGGEVGYWDSWWCLGEFLTIVRMKSNEQLPEDFKIMLFNPDDENPIQELPHDKIPYLTAEQNRELARYFANGDFLESGLEAMDGMRKRRWWPKFARRILYNLLEKYVWPQIGKNGEFDGMTFEYFEESIHSHVYDKSFTENRILVCPSCMAQGKTINEILSNDNFVWEFLNINNYYSDHKLHGVRHNSDVVIVSEKNLKRYLQKDGSYLVACENGHNITIKKSDDLFYLYWTPRRGQYTGPNKCIIETVELYYVAI